MRGLHLSPGGVGIYLLRLLASSLAPSAAEAGAVIGVKRGAPEIFWRVRGL